MELRSSACGRAQSNYPIFTLKTEICDISLVRLALDFVCVLHLGILGMKKSNFWSKSSSVTNLIVFWLSSVWRNRILSKKIVISSFKKSTDWLKWRSTVLGWSNWSVDIYNDRIQPWLLTVVSSHLQVKDQEYRQRQPELAGNWKCIFELRPFI